MLNFFCLSGGYGIGKTTAAVKISNNNLSTQHLALGDCVREDMEFNIPKLFFPNKSILYIKPTPTYIRDLIKGYAESVKYHNSSADKLVWVKKLIKKVLPETNYVIIDDMRFYYDLEFLIDEFGKDNVYSIYIDSSSNGYELEKLRFNSHIHVKDSYEAISFVNREISRLGLS